MVSLHCNGMPTLLQYRRGSFPLLSWYQSAHPHCMSHPLPHAFMGSSHTWAGLNLDPKSYREYRTLSRLPQLTLVCPTPHHRHKKPAHPFLRPPSLGVPSRFWSLRVRRPLKRKGLKPNPPLKAEATDTAEETGVVLMWRHGPFTSPSPTTTLLPADPQSMPMGSSSCFRL